MGIDVNLIALGNVGDDEMSSAIQFMNNRLGELKHFGPWLERGPSFMTEDYGAPAILVSCDGQRLYSAVYPRGHWPRIHNILVTAQAALPECRLFYGSDVDDHLGREVDDDILGELWGLWLTGSNPHKADSRGVNDG